MQIDVAILSFFRLLFLCHQEDSLCKKPFSKTARYDGGLTTVLTRNTRNTPEDAEDTAPAASSSPGVALGTADGATEVVTSEATDVAADESVVTADGAADDTHASASAYTTGMDIGAVATSSATAARKRKGRSKQAHVAQDARKRQRGAALLLTTQGNTEAGT